MKDVPNHRLTDPEEIAKNSKIHDIKKVEGGEKQQHKPSKMNRIKRALNWVVRTTAGETKVGEGIHGVLDLLPIPNQIIAKALSYFSKGNATEAKDELRKLFSVRNGIALIAFILFVTGVIGFDELERLLERVL